ncbi:hypothetical protein R4J17_06300 [Brachyspira intermedia]|uniref:LysM domain-containing protein n=1 Tax=Brachyspira intermedia (strain ATCC 51140 / PWS/A) TaxID=1045858 RepID=G0EQM8_BRAIP|nr:MULTISPECIES: hypothetical protein [Brachyspira]AEM22129.1 hypothetical protein Bint_1510 [Brachyspira intermedia PWS/A]
MPSKHLVKQNEDLKQIAIQYYGTTQKINLIIKSNSFLAVREIINSLPQIIEGDILFIP